MGLTNRELEIKMTLQDEATKKIQSVNQSIKQMGGEAKGFLAPLASVHRAILRVGMVWAATFGLMVKAVQDASKELDRMDTLSVKLGTTTTDLSKRIYGFNLSTDNFRIAQGQMAALGEKAKESWLGFGKIIGDAWGALTKFNRAIPLYNQMTVGKDFNFQQREELWSRANQIADNQLLAERHLRKSRTPEALNAEAGLQGELDKLTNSGFDFKQLQLKQQIDGLRIVGVEEQKLNEFSLAQTQRLTEDKEIAYRTLASKQLEISGNTIEALKLQQENELIEFKRQWGDSGEMVAIFKRGQEAVLKQKKLSTLGLKSIDMIMQDNFKSEISDMTDAMATFVNDAFSNKLQKARNYFALFGAAILETWSKTVAQMVATSIWGNQQMGASSGGILGTIMGVLGKAAGMINPFAGIIGGIGGTVTNTAQFGNVWSPSNAQLAAMGYHDGGAIRSYHSGGFIRAHDGLAVDEVPIIAQRGEYVLSRRGVDAAGGTENLNRINRGEPVRGGMTTNVHFHINAIDPKSGTEFIMKHHNEIAAIIHDKISKNTSLRSSIKTCGH